MARVITSATPFPLTFMVEGTLDMARNTNVGTFCCVTRRETNENILREELKKATRFRLLFVKPPFIQLTNSWRNPEFVSATFL
jgi:hypothetical protein